MNNGMLEIVIDSVRVSLMSPQRLVVLRQKDADRYLPIWVGPYEAEAITVALQEIEMARPLTHDLLKTIISTFNARILRIEIIALREDIFYGNIVVETEDGRHLNVDSRPSDAIAIAIRAHVSIFVVPDVMDTAGITPEQDISAQKPPSTQASASASAPLRSTPAPLAETKDDRLSIFEDFLSGLDLDKPPAKDDDDPDKPEDKPKKKGKDK
jgi:bifunctional DNase/RNase